MKKIKPIIGITADSAIDEKGYSYAVKPWYALRMCYTNIVEQCGGVPIILPYNQDINSTLDLIDGLIISGGREDINPKFYGQEIESEFVSTNDQRAIFELELLKVALHKDLPILGICNGLQVINTYFGGTLFQHLPHSIESKIEHEQPAPKDIATHDIIIQPGSILATLSATDRVMVNSTHHQAVDQLGKDLKISAMAPDGVIEAIESTIHKFVVGVEWHPEYLNSKLDAQLFHKLIAVSN